MRNIMLFIDDAAGAETLATKAMKVARQCRADLRLCNVAGSMVYENVFAGNFGDDDLMPKTENFDINGLALRLQAAAHPEDVFVPTVDCFEISNFNPAIIKEMVVRHNIWLIIMDERQLNHIKNSESGACASNVINGLNCPVLLMPQRAELSDFNKIAYLTDLRYCDLGVIKFLTVFNAALFVTHLSAPGLPDMEERYAQEILAEEVSMKAHYLKIFLRNIRNIKNKNVKTPVNNILDTVGIKMLALVNKKHQTFERLFDNFPKKTQIYHNLPTLIFPYLNWFNQASFYL